MLSPIAARAAVTFLVSAGSEGPFDSHVGTLALLNLVAVRVSARAPSVGRRPARHGRVGVARRHETLTDGD